MSEVSSSSNAHPVDECCIHTLITNSRATLYLEIVNNCYAAHVRRMSPLLPSPSQFPQVIKPPIVCFYWEVISYSPSQCRLLISAISEVVVYGENQDAKLAAKAAKAEAIRLSQGEGEEGEPLNGKTGEVSVADIRRQDAFFELFW